MSGAGSQLHFRGALALPNDNEPSLIVDLRVEDEVVVITQDSELIGSWSVEDVNAERLNGQKFRLLLGEDEVIFHARDRLGFAYNGLNAIREAKERREQRKSKWWFEKLVDGEAAAPSPSDWVGKTVASLKNAVARTTTPRRQETDRPKRTPERETPRSAAPPTPKPAEPATPAAGEPSAVAETASTPTTEPASDEPWGIPPEPAAPARQSTSVRGGRHRGKPADHDDDVRPTIRGRWSPTQYCDVTTLPPRPGLRPEAARNGPSEITSTNTRRPDSRADWFAESARAARS